jgi:hypothetical protein
MDYQGTCDEGMAQTLRKGKLHAAGARHAGGAAHLLIFRCPQRGSAAEVGKIFCGYDIRSFWGVTSVVMTDIPGHPRHRFYNYHLGGPFASWLVLWTGFQFISAYRPQVFGDFPPNLVMLVSQNQLVVVSGSVVFV